MRLVLTLLLLLLPHTMLAQTPIRIVVLGSSTAEGTGANPRADSAWVNQFRNVVLAANPNNRVYNLAIGGYTTYDIMPTGFVPPAGRPTPKTGNNISWAIDFWRATAILINLPSNDATRGFSVQEQLANYDRILEVAGNRPVWISTTQPRNLDATGRANLIAMRDSTFARYGNRALDFWTGLARPDGSLDPRFDVGDGIHLNNAGHRLLFQRAVEAGIVQTLTSHAPDGPATEVPVRFWPHPADTHLTLEVALRSPSPVHVRVTDLQGRELFAEHHPHLPAETHRLHIDSRAWAPGPYLYHVETLDGMRAGLWMIAR